MVQTVEINGNFDKQNGASAVSGKLYFTLNKRDFDGPTIIEPIAQAVELDDAGAFSGLALWPNDRGRTNSAYLVEYMAMGSSRKEVIAKTLFVPESTVPHQLSDLILASDLASSIRVDRVIPISAADYEQRLTAGTLQDALYLVEGV